MADQPLYRLNAEEKRLFQKAKTNVDVFTDYYLRNDTSGTWWYPGALRPRWKQGYDTLYKAWVGEKRPEPFVHQGVVYKIVWEHDESADYPDLPAFHHNHGVLMLPYQNQMHEDRHTVITCVGGKGSSKTYGFCLSDLVNAAMLPGYRSFILGPLSVTVEEAFRVMKQIMDGTLFQERFVVKTISKPYPLIVIANDRVGESTIEFFSIKDDPTKLLTMTGDRAVIDQAEKLDDYPAILDAVGTRFRGRIKGRSRLGTLTFVANSANNQQFWDLHDMAEVNPKHYSAYTVSSYDNPHLTDRDIERFEIVVGGDAESIRVSLKAGRPRGNGKEFSREVLERMTSHDLVQRMTDGINADLPGYIRLKQQGVGIHEWLLPPEPGHTYLVISDPGTDNPPHRNSPPIFIWDITDFPGTKQAPKPMLLVGFVWVFGRGDILNWATRFAELVRYYRAVGRCAFDATGHQAGYDTWMPILENLFVEKLSFAGNAKPLMLNAGKIVASWGLAQVPAELDQLFSQLERYDITEDRPGSKLRQDLVMAFIMSCFWAQRLWYGAFMDSFEADTQKRSRPPDPDDRTQRFLEDRYGSHVR